MSNIKQVGSNRASLGEGPVWDEATQCLFWVDSLQGILFRLDHEKTDSWQLPCMVGSLAVIDDLRVLLALQTGFHLFNLNSRTLTPIQDPESDNPDTRFNDGKTDSCGSFLAGSMGIKIRDRGLGALYRLKGDLSLEVLEDDVVVANGPCFSPDGQTFYFNDGRRRILAYDYNPDGPLSNKRVFFDGHQYETGSDGATVDAEGNLWVALIGSGEIGCIHPDGTLIERIPMPVDLPSSVMFGGPDLRTLYITSISDSGNRQSHSPGAGGLYRIDDLGVRGIAERRFSFVSN